MSIYYEDEWVTLYHAWTRNDDMIKCHTWHSELRNVKPDTGLASGARSSLNSPGVQSDTSSLRSMSRHASGSVTITTLGRGTKFPSRVGASAPSACIPACTRVKNAGRLQPSVITAMETPRTTQSEISASFAAGVTCERTVA